MDFIDSVTIHRYHKDRIEQYGQGSSAALGWKTPEGQSLRFEVLSQIGDLNHASVLDAGCGHGDLCGFLHERFTDVRYFGVDLEAPFLDIAIQKYGHMADTAFFLGDFTQASLPVTDYVLVCGSLNYRSVNPDFVCLAITKLFQSCRFGLGFNLLSKAEHTDGPLVAYDPKQIMSLCLGLSSNVVLRDGYHGNDFTVLMYHCT